MILVIYPLETLILSSLKKTKTKNRLFVKGNFPITIKFMNAKAFDLTTPLLETYLQNLKQMHLHTP